MGYHGCIHDKLPKLLHFVCKPIVFLGHGLHAHFLGHAYHMYCCFAQIAGTWTYEGNLGMCPFQSLEGPPWDVCERGKRLQRTH